MKKTSIYVFSATGNSLTTAVQLHSQIKDSILISVASVLSQDEVIEDAERTIFVFPVYFQDVPYPVKMLIQKMKWTCSHPEIYCLTTSRKVPGTNSVYQRLNAVLETKGQSLRLALSIPMPGNSWANLPEEDEEYLLKQKENIQKCLHQMESSESKDYSVKETLKRTPVSDLNNYRGIVSDDRCTGCGRCVKICPMNNITIEEKKAVIGNHCAVCLACFHWCKEEALWMSKNMEDGRRKKYHHPETSYEDIVKMKTR